MDQPLSRAERRALKKQIHAQKREADMTKRKTGKVLWTVFLVLILGGILVWIVAGFFQEKPGVNVSIQSREHIQFGSKHEAYNSNPPTSGPHYPQWSKCGIFDEEILPETLVHNMEHGHVVIFYKPDLPKDEKEKLQNFVEERLSSRNILMASNKNIPSNIALASWGWYQLFEKIDEEAMHAFYKAHKYKAPERIPCDVK